jgi:hypothetical protein
MIIDLKDIIDDDLIYNYFSQKVDHAMKNPSSLKMTPIRDHKLDYIGYNFYCDYLSIMFHSKITPFVSKILNKELIPSFCFTRMYFEGSKLNFHKDRPSCEIILSHCHYGKPWKIYVEEEAFMTETGTSICYEGNKNVHGRITPIANNALYSFYSWVEKDGEYYDWKYDKSKKLEKVYLSALDKTYI